MKKIKVLALVFVFAFAALGGAYAAWSDSLFVTETVKTGTLDVKWVSPESDDPSGNSEYEGYDVGSLTLDGTDGLFDDTDIADNDDGGFEGTPDPRCTDDLMKITLTNGHPGYVQSVTATIKNVGSIPVKLAFAATDAPADWLTVKIVDASDTTDNTVYYSSDSSAPAISTASVLDKEGSSANNTLKVKIITEVKDDAPENVTDESFTLKVTGTQWNK